MTCKDCIHYEACKSLFQHYGDELAVEALETDGLCGYFADKSLYIKLPCKVGTPVYMISRGRSKTEYIEIDGKTYSRSVPQRYITVHKYGLEDYAIGYEIGKQIYLTKEEAEAALKEMESECTNHQ